MAMAEERDTTVAPPVPADALSGASLPGASLPGTALRRAVPAETVPPPVRRSPPARRRPRGRAGARTFRRVTALLMVAALIATGDANVPDRLTPGWASPGLVGGGGWPFAGVPLTPAEAEGAAYLPDSSVVRLADGRIRLIPTGGKRPVTVAADDPRVDQAVRSDNAWLARGTIPTGGANPATGSDMSYRDMSARALLDLRLLTRTNGASLASWYSKWRYAWPRDSAFAVAAFAVTGHPSEARDILGFLSGVQNEDGMWAARYNPDGTAVSDGRHAQLDSLGWVLWATWFYQVHSVRTGAELPDLWPMVQRAADNLARSLDAEGLPPASSDYWERHPRHEQDPRRPTLGVVGPVLAGLRSAADLAERRGDGAKAAEWQHAAGRVSAAVDRQFAPYGYPRSPVPRGLMDTSVTFIAPPFAAADPDVTAAIADAARKQALPNGGVLPGERWAGDKEVAWTPEVAMFGLNAAAAGRTDDALSRLSWLSAHRTSLGALPEKVGPDGRPAGPAPLGWTASLVLLSLYALERPLPVPPAD
ncbi:glycoside hydrolase family 15 protein [Actinomadura sp. KC345]|uniref:glycoside hydrolase family 15 protein n=1 Tax=Actinomadura sp. KC345 TaxID=2530371 RepID=UPI001FB7B129|nr:glycoside hydrolase family 15 protein [Actinomadura sp. KC345]